MNSCSLNLYQKVLELPNVWRLFFAQCWESFYCHEIPQLFCYHTTLQTLPPKMQPIQNSDTHLKDHFLGPKLLRQNYDVSSRS